MHTSAYIIFFKETTEGSQDYYPGPENICSDHFCISFPFICLYIPLSPVLKNDFLVHDDFEILSMSIWEQTQDTQYKFIF